MTLNERLPGHPPSLSQEMLTPSAVLTQAKQLVEKGSKNQWGMLTDFTGKAVLSAETRPRWRRDFAEARAVNLKGRPWKAPSPGDES